jgi:hypothetical protein
MPVHFSGLAVDMDAVQSIAAKHGLRVIEDAAHAIGSRYRGRLIGSFGDLAVFSFHPNKNMTSHRGRRDRHGDEGRPHGSSSNIAFTASSAMPRARST